MRQHLLFLAVLLFVAAGPVMAQHVVHNEFVLLFSDNQGNVDTLTVGTDDRATRGIDDILGEYEAPPLPPSGFDVRLISNRVGETLLGIGVKIDYLPIPTDAALKDTFVVKFQNTDAQTANFKLSWNHNFIPKACDSMIVKVGAFIDPNTSEIIVPARSINMATTDSVVLVDPQDYAVSTIKIWKYGYRSEILGVKPVQEPVPGTFSLHPAYPNPFNPTTSLRFDLAKSSMVDIAVFNLLGQKVATLVSSELSAGVYTTQWNGRSAQGSIVGSGMYFVRMTARSLSNGVEQFSSLQKVLLMK